MAKVKDPKSGEERDETDDERKAREAAARETEDEGDDDIEKVRAERDRLKAEARKWEKRAKDNFAAKVGVPWDEITTNAQKYQDLQQQSKTDAQKQADETAAAQKERDETKLEIRRLRVAMRKGLSDAQAKRLIGATEEELEADADELLKSFVKKDDDDPDAGVTRRPRAALRPGSGRTTEPEADTTAVVDQAYARSR